MLILYAHFQGYYVPAPGKTEEERLEYNRKKREQRARRLERQRQQAAGSRR